jgi:MFS family permease
MNAVIADISPPAERGSYMGFVFAGSLLGQPTGLILGGVLSHFYGWRAVFWLLFVLAGLFFVPYIGFMPETCRKIVGNGSVRPATWWNLPVVDMLQHRRVTAGTFDEATGSFAGGKASGATTSPFSTLKALNPLTTVIILAEKSAGGIILCTGLLYAGLAAVTVGLPFYFKESHDLNDLEIGLAFLPIGFGSCVAAISTGALADWNYKRHAHRLGLPTHQGAQQDMSVFPIEAARLQIALPLVVVGIVAMIIYGWVLQVRAPIALPLAVNCVLAFIVTGAFSIMSTLLIDLNADRPATATAANNLFRSLLGAGVTMALIPMWDVFGIGWTFMIFAATWVLVAAVMLVLMRRGLMWRRTQQEAKMEPSEAQALAKDVELEDPVDGESDDGKV